MGRAILYGQRDTGGILLGNLPIGALVKDPNTTYYDEPIVWRIVDKNHEGYPSNSVTLISENIICIKSFDAMEPQNSDSNRREFGNNRYSVSNILQWLNSDAEAGLWYMPQHSADAPPNANNTTSGLNPYESERGLLSHFSGKISDALLPTTVNVGLNERIDGGGFEQVTSKLFLASATEAGLGEEAGVIEGSILLGFLNDPSCVLAKPTAEAVANSTFANDGLSAQAYWRWWLRTPRLDSSFGVRWAGPQGELNNSQAAYGGTGTRVLCNLSLMNRVQPEPDADGVYILKF